MDHGKRPFTIQEPLLSEPRQKFLPIRCGENRLQRVFRTNCRDLFRHGKEEEIVVAQDGDGPISKVLDVAKDAQRVRATIDQIADEPEAISGRVESNMLDETLQRFVTSLHISDRVGGHE